MGASIVWLRDDLRLSDNPALTAAAERGEPIVLLFVLDDGSHGIRAHGGASRWWLHHSLDSLADAAASAGGVLTLRSGDVETVLPQIIAEVGAGAVFWNRRYGGGGREIDTRLKQAAKDDGLDVRSFQANLLFEPWTLKTGSGEPYRVFTPFWRAAREVAVRDPLPTPRGLTWAAAHSEQLAGWELLPTKPDWAEGLHEMWHPGEQGAHDRLEHFVEHGLAQYHRRDEPAVEATSRLSPHLRFGEISPFQVWHRLHGQMSAGAHKNAEKYLSELVWREFNHSILFAHPDLADHNYRPTFDAFPWAWSEVDESNADADDVLPKIEAWKAGRTGIPLVDAGMRELWHTGYMHNRVRMVTASFLIKNLLVDWRIGEQWFWDCLVDADEANNPGNWQWTAGTGADAAPYFRVFNPVLQAAKFDPDGTYVRRWVPELGTPEYPEPIVDLGQTRREALAAFEQVKARSQAARPLS